MNEIVNYLRQEYGHFPVLVGQFDAVLSRELSSHLLVKGVSVPYKSDQKVPWLWKRVDSSFRFRVFSALASKRIVEAYKKT